MKRPVFWAVVMFALGEVFGQYVQTGKQISIAFVMLICFVLFLCCLERKIKRFNHFFLKWMILIGVPIGFLHNFFFAGSKQLERYKLPEDIKTVSVTARITEFTVTEHGRLATVTVKKCERQEVKRAIGRRLTVALPESMTLQVGDLIYLEGYIQTFLLPENPGEFDQRQYNLSRGIRYKMPKPDEIILIERPSFSYRKTIQILRDYLRENMYQATDKVTAGLYAGILLGDKSDISKETRALFLMAGIAHILSISALHISLVSMSVYRILRRFGVKIKISAMVSGSMILIYGGLTNWSFSALRAAIMLFLVLLGEILGRKSDLLTGASVSLFLILIAEPERMKDGGVQIGFVSVVAIALGQAVLIQLQKYTKLQAIHKHHRWLYKVISAIVTSISIFFLTAPVLARLYYFVSPYSPFLNLIVVPLMTPVVMLGLLGMLASLLGLPFGGILFSAGGSILQLFCMLCRCVVKLPFCIIGIGKPELTEIICYYFVIAVFVMLLSGQFRGWLRKTIYARTHKWYSGKVWKNITLVIVSLYVLISGFALVCIHNAYLCEEVVFLSVGQGDGILIRTESGVNIVIDGGSSTRQNLGEYILKPALKSEAMQRVDYWFVSHADADHMNGLLEILEEGVLSGIQIKTIVVAKAAVEDFALDDLIWKAEQLGTNIYYMQIGDCLTKEGVFRIQCLGPETQAVFDRNGTSLCIMYTSKNFEILFTGDAGAGELKLLIKNCELQVSAQNATVNKSQQPIRIIKVPHHGSRYSYVNGLYDTFDYAVVSCGANNRYGHPHEEVAEGITSSGSVLLRTDEKGAIVFRK